MVQGASTPKKIALEMACLNIGVRPAVAIYEMMTRCAFCDGTYKMHGWTCFVDCSIEDSKLRREEEGAGSKGAHSIYIL
jgi:hypothetical protein